MKKKKNLDIPNFTFGLSYQIQYTSFAASMIHQMAWNDETNQLVALTDGKLSVWSYPSVVFVDTDLLQRTVFEKSTR